MGKLKKSQVFSFKIITQKIILNIYIFFNFASLFHLHFSKHSINILKKKNVAIFNRNSILQ